MKKIIQGILDFKKHSSDQREQIRQLAEGQRPDALIVACSDSRVTPNFFTSSRAGDLFYIRNVGNIVPCCDAHGTTESDCSEPAAIEFAVNQLKIKDIIVCGHSDCGAMKALLGGGKVEGLPHLTQWLKGELGALDDLTAKADHFKGDTDLNRLSKLNVLRQIENLKTHPHIKEAMSSGQLSLHAWWFDIPGAEVLVFDPETQDFVSFTEDHL